MSAAERALLSTSAELMLDAGLAPFQCCGVQIWGRQEGDVWPYFGSSVAHRRGRTQLLGVVGVHVPAFEAWWQDLLRAHPPDRGIGDTLLFGCFITNFPQFFDPPEFAPNAIDSRQLGAWIDAIITKLNPFPTSLGQLLQHIAQGELGSDSLEKYVGHAVKALAFERWCSAAAGVDVTLPRTFRRVEPYERVFAALST